MGAPLEQPRETQREELLPIQQGGRGRVGLARFVYRRLLLRKLLSVKVILAQMSNKYAPS